MTGQRYPKHWKCPSDQHILGQVIRINGVSYLDLYRQAVLPDSPGVIMARLFGTVYDIRCSICGRTRTWCYYEERTTEFLEKIQATRSAE